ncbi:MAG TPA: L-histidine N(alpha)-methyltransferase [Zeimonas sp.]|nr:L-histidine N(alpha)-methyltransferase [Zeimonas sp.]
MSTQHLRTSAPGVEPRTPRPLLRPPSELGRGTAQLRVDAVDELAAHDERIERTGWTSYDPRFAGDVLEGLSKAQKSIPSTWLYDQRGSQLFEAITELPEYYATRTEIALLRQCAGAIAEEAGPDATMIEIGSGSSRKTPLLLGAMARPYAYVPVDISGAFLMHSAALLRGRFPDVRILPVVGDFKRPVQLPHALRFAPPRGRRLVFFPGSTIGNLTPEEAVSCLARLADLCGANGLIVLGVDQNRNEETLLPAYNDAAGITAAFNLNLLERINRELGGTFDIGAFRHESRYDRERRRIEMHLISVREQSAEVLRRGFAFAQGETIHTENSYKYDRIAVETMAARAGLHRRAGWVDERERFAIHLLVPRN